MEHWQETLQDLELSGKSITQYCKDLHIKPHTIRYWKQKLRKQDSPGFVSIATGVSPMAIEISYPSGVRLKLASGISIKDLKSLLHV